MPEHNYNAIIKAYKKLWGLTAEKVIPDTDNDGVPFLIEKNFT